MQQKHRTLVTSILERVAKQMKIKITIEPVWGYVGQIILQDGRTRYFRNTNLDINSLGSSEIARDKNYADYFLKRMGYPIIPGRAFFTRRWNKVLETDNGPDKAYAYAKSIGFPVIVKPNSKSQGLGVAKAYNRKDLMAAVRRIEQFDRVFLVQRVMMGHDYRIVVIDQEVISAYERLPLSVTGNGRSTVQQLLLAKQKMFVKTGRDTQIKLKDPRITRELQRMHFTRRSVLKKGETIVLLPNANLSTGGDALDATDVIHPQWKVLARNIARDMNLRYIGIDIMSKETLEKPPRDYVVIEINAAPGLDNYSAMGPRQKRIVEGLYRKALEALIK